MSSNNLTDRERQLMAMAWMCMESEPKVSIPSPHLISPHSRPSSHPSPISSPTTANQTHPQVDNKKLAAMAGMSNPVSASNAWARIKKKIAAQAPAAVNGSATPTPKATPSKKRMKAAVATAAGAGEASGDDDESPTKKARNGGGEKGEESVSPVKKAMQPKAVAVKKEQPVFGFEDDGGEESLM
jgi:hypothetical protein